MLTGCSSSRAPAKPRPDRAALEQSGNSNDIQAAAVPSPEDLERRADAHAHYAASIIHELNDEPELAADELYQAALNDTDNESLVLDVTRRLLQFKKADKALDLLQKATANPNASGNLFARLGLVYALLDKKEDAIEADRTAIRKMPKSFVGYQNLARLYLQNNQNAEGLKTLDQASKQAGNDSGFLIDLAELYTAFSLTSTNFAATAKTQALEMLQRASKLNPNNPVQLQKMGDGFAMLGEPEKAAGVYQKLLERFPNLPGLREKLAEIYLRKQDREKAAEQLEAIIRNTPTNPQAHYFLGGIAFEEKKWKEAAEHYQSAILVNQAFEPAYYDLALAQMNMDEANQALSTLEKARKRFKETFTGEFFAALAYGRLKDYSNALSHFTAAEVIARATDTNRLTHVFYFQFGAAYEQAKNFEEAEKHLKKCLELTPDYPDALNYLGYMWADRGVNLPKAKELIEKAVEAEPKNAAFLDSLGWVLYKLDRPKDALPWLLKSIENSKEADATLYDHLGDVYSALKQSDKAQEAWKKALSIEPKDEIKKKLETSASESSGATR